MSDYVLIDGDQAVFQPTFGPATVAVRPGKLTGSGPAEVNDKKMCIDGDEKQLSVPGCSYFTPLYSIPGVGTLKIDTLAANQKAKYNQTGGKAVLLKGGNFTAKFEVQTPAMQAPPTSTPDTMTAYSGQGSFITKNTIYQAT